jgi:hypothetical protein
MHCSELKQVGVFCVLMREHESALDLEIARRSWYMHKRPRLTHVVYQDINIYVSPASDA